MDLANECKDVMSEFFTRVELDALVVWQEMDQIRHCILNSYPLMRASESKGFIINETSSVKWHVHHASH